MVQNINKLNGKIAENGYNKKEFAKIIGLSETTLRRKAYTGKSDFSISESLLIKDKLSLSNQDYLDIFFGPKLEFNSNYTCEHEF